MPTTTNAVRFPRSAATGRLRRFLTDAIHRIADAPLYSPIVTGLRPTTRAAALAHGACQRSVLTVYLTCDARQERRVQALLSDVLITSGLRYAGIRAQRRGDTVEFEAAVTVHGAPGRAVKPLLSRLFLQPGVQDVRWSAVDARPPSPRGPHAVAA